MVKIKRAIGRLGNNLFQYAASRILAERNNLYLETEWQHDDILKLLPWDNKGEKITDPEVKIIDSEQVNMLKVLTADYHKKKVVMDGYFQEAMFFYSVRKKIRSWFEPCEMESFNGWVLHYRVCDYWVSHVDSVIHPAWYLNNLRSEGVLKSKEPVIIITEDPKDPCIKDLAGVLKSPIVSYGVKDSFNILRAAKKIMCSNGSFAWWASFLGNPEVCYMFDPWMRYHKNMQMKYPGPKWVPGRFAYSSQMRSKWDMAVRGTGGLEKYWDNWKKNI